MYLWRAFEVKAPPHGSLTPPPPAGKGRRAAVGLCQRRPEVGVGRRVAMQLAMEAEEGGKVVVA